MSLTIIQRKALLDALQEAFPTYAKLAGFLSLELGKNLDSIALGNDLPEIALKIIQDAESKGWENSLIFSARDANPGNPKLANFVREYEREYWEYLESEVYAEDLDEKDAEIAIAKVRSELSPVLDAQFLDVTKKTNYPEKLLELLEEIRDKLNEDESPAVAKAKLALPLIPGVLSYEVELDTEDSLRKIFRPLRRFFEKGINEGK
jgi:Effector-associated domain 1